MRLPNQIRAVACVGWVSILGLGQYFAQSAGPSRLGVIRERVSGYAPDALGAQDAPPRLRNEQTTPVESLAAKAGSPGFAFDPRQDGYGVKSSRPDRTRRVVDRTQRARVALPAQNSDYLRDAPGGHFQPYEVTAYSHHCTVPIGPERPPQRMANGEWPIAGLHVAGPPEMRLGSVVEVVYRGLPSRLIVGDRGRAIRGRRLDLFLADCGAARAWGRRTAYVREVSE